MAIGIHKRVFVANVALIDLLGSNKDDSVSIIVEFSDLLEESLAVLSACRYQSRTVSDSRAQCHDFFKGTFADE